MTGLRDEVEREARGAAAALPAIADEPVTAALLAAAELLGDRSRPVLEADAADVAGAAGRLAEGSLARPPLDATRREAIGAQLRELAALPPLERGVAEWTLPNGLHV